MGFAICSFIPDFLERTTSSAKALAVMAIIGTSLVYFRSIYHALKGKAGKSLEIIQALTAEYLKDRTVGIEKLFITLRLINEKASGDVFAYLLYDRKCLLI